LRRYSHTFTVDADIEKVWSFYTNIDHLEIVTPSKMRLKVLRCSTGQWIVEGAEVWLQANLIVKSSWHSKITYLKPYVYIDEMLKGRFRVWRHTHSFQRSSAGRGTIIIDEIDFELRYGALGKMLEGFVERQLAKIFAYRRDATVKALK
jgi:ligand-binding SRPBCC domain-containing protein